MTGNDRFDNSVIVERRLLFRDESIPVPDLPIGAFSVAAYIFSVASHKKRHLERSPWPKMRPLIAQVTARVRKGQRVRKIEPADVVRDCVRACAIEAIVEMEQIEG